MNRLLADIALSGDLRDRIADEVDQRARAEAGHIAPGTMAGGLTTLLIEPSRDDAGTLSAVEIVSRPVEALHPDVVLDGGA
ncbi:hypothetical protein [Fulvimarina sp. MAC3]|uniref:hypothetical protein n=1 Tax=Fulvimarina sp. MAC3 TaxID=3148887 RepID=UPI0031FD4DE4